MIKVLTPKTVAFFFVLSVDGKKSMTGRVAAKRHGMLSFHSSFTVYRQIRKREVNGKKSMAGRVATKRHGMLSFHSTFTVYRQIRKRDGVLVCQEVYLNLFDKNILTLI